eukprot:TRINITY_DN7907_c0_g1_i2.p1 TRINITY_DN7907_c0_g1~~TRINITY_DN7907_c0_g1_i2.p1  ORF type:complete len:187 (+),score=43.66 TRINITY_DN7907_c0_g1_i2:188-748(+)
MDNRKAQLIPEQTSSEYIFRIGQAVSDRAKNPPSYIMHLKDLNPELCRDLEKFVKEKLEEWTGLKDLQHTATYGIREYLDGTVLANHVDRFETHVLSAIVHVGDILPREDWLLQVQDRRKAPKSIAFTRDIDVVLYESSTLVHGRTIPFQGERYANIFFHFAPNDWHAQLLALPGDPWLTQKRETE